MNGCAPSIATLTPSRGLLHSRTAERVVAEGWRASLTGTVRLLEPKWWFVTHDLGIPACFNSLVDAALEAGADLLWFVEEDIIPPIGAIHALINALREKDALVASIDYPLPNPDGKVSNCAYGKDGVVTFTGTGCMMIDARLAAVLPRPWFETSNELQIVRRGQEVEYVEFGVPYVYGGHDVTFFIKKLEPAKVRTAYVDPKVAWAHHARVEKERHEKETNDGCHEITVHEVVTPGRWLTPQEFGRL